LASRENAPVTRWKRDDIARSIESSFIYQWSWLGWLGRCMHYAMTSEILTGVDSLMQHGAHRLHVNRDVNTHSRWSEVNKG
jgi:hypothetical protein